MTNVKGTDLKIFEATIIRSSRRVFNCLVTSDQSLIEATAKGTLLKDAELVVGDRVLLTSQGTTPPSYEILELIPRQNSIFRFIPRERNKKVIAANVDFMIIVTSLERPEYKQGLVDRFLLRAELWNTKSLLVFNKADHFRPDSQNTEFAPSLSEHNAHHSPTHGPLDLKDEVQRLKSLIHSAYEISSNKTNGPEYAPRFLSLGLKELKETISNKKVVVLGQSGVGKSSLISMLTDYKINLKNNIIGKAGKGMHTTTWCELISHGPYHIIDSPGIRGLAIDDIDADELIHLMPDLYEISIKCQFTNCHHFSKSKGCAFYTPLKKDHFTLSRLDSFHRFQSEISDKFIR